MDLTAEVLQGFVGSVLIKNFDEAAGIPQFHKDLWEYACSKHKYVAIAAPRGHAKSTAGTLAYVLASVLFRASKYVVIVSDTEAQAAMFLGNIKQELIDNEVITELFGLKTNEKGVIFKKENETELVVETLDNHKFKIVAKGAEQKLRGLNWKGTRPDLVVGDDLENDELVMNKERREKLHQWFFGALLPCISPRGKVRIWGTILHSASLLESFMPKETDPNTVHDGLKQYNRINRRMWVGVKYAAHNADFSQLLWEERFSAEFFREKQAEYALQGISDVYAREYLNRPIDDSIAYFKRQDLLRMTKEDREKRFTYYITGDLAISDKERSDYSVFLIAGIDENRMIHVLDVIRDRLDGREIVDLILALERKYKPFAIGIEEMQVSQAIGPFLREEMIAQNTFPTLIPMKHMGKDKQTRAKSIQGRLRARTVKFDHEGDWYPTFEDEVLRFPRGAKDDQVDAIAYLGLLLDKVVEAPTKDEVEDEEYEDELRVSQWNNNGRSRITGY